MQQRMSGPRFMELAYPVSNAHATAFCRKISNTRFLLLWQNATLLAPHSWQGEVMMFALAAKTEKEWRKRPRIAHFTRRAFASNMTNAMKSAKVSALIRFPPTSSVRIDCKLMSGHFDCPGYRLRLSISPCRLIDFLAWAMNFVLGIWELKLQVYEPEHVTKCQIDSRRAEVSRP